MNYVEFENTFKLQRFINLADIRINYPNFDSRRLYEWQKKGYLHKIGLGFYYFTKKELESADFEVLANRLCEPSYLSLEYALNIYGLIPEIVPARTSVTTKKTNHPATGIGNFIYRSVKPELFFGYKLVKVGKQTYKIAEPEKALLDFLYLRKDINDTESLEELRINEFEFNNKINLLKLKKYLAIFDSEVLDFKVRQLYKILNIKYD